MGLHGHYPATSTDELCPQHTVVADIRADVEEDIAGREHMLHPSGDVLLPQAIHQKVRCKEVVGRVDD